MPKIRGVHPDIWTDEDFVELTPFARLLWLGMWNYACDNGHLADRSKQIKMRVLPTDDVNAAELLRELETNGRIVRSNGWITVPNFSKRQRPDKRFWVVCEAPGCTKPDDSKRETRSAPVEPPRRHRAPTSRPRPDGEGEGEGEGELKVSSTPSPKGSDTPPRFDEFWSVYGKKVKRADAEKKFAKALTKEPADRIIAAAAAYVGYERANNHGGRYIADPSTWLHGERWRDERSDLPVPITRVQEHLSLVQQLAAEEAGTLQIGDGR